MSWSFYSTGAAHKCISEAVAFAQSPYKCVGEEEEIKQEIIASVIKSLHTYPTDANVTVNAYGSAYVTDNKVTRNEFTCSVKASA